MIMFDGHMGFIPGMQGWFNTKKIRTTGKA
jgi:hypothetical protein